MLNRICKSFSSQLTHITGPIPHLREERMPCGDIRLMKDRRRAPTIVHLQEVRAVPACWWVQGCLVWIQIIWCALLGGRLDIYNTDDEREWV